MQNNILVRGTPKQSHITPGGNLPRFANHWVKRYNRVFGWDSWISTIQTWKK